MRLCSVNGQRAKPDQTLADRSGSKADLPPLNCDVCFIATSEHSDGNDNIRFVPVAEAKVLKGANPTGHAVWWYSEAAAGRNAFCFAPGTLS
jgi:hypothetical protein